MNLDKIDERIALAETIAQQSDFNTQIVLVLRDLHDIAGSLIAEANEQRGELRALANRIEGLTRKVTSSAEPPT